MLLLHWEIAAVCFYTCTFDSPWKEKPMPLAQKIANARRQEEEAARTQQEESEAQTAAAEKEEEFEELFARLSSAINEFSGIVKLVFQTDDSGKKVADFDITAFDPDDAKELTVAFEQMLDCITGGPRTRRLLFTRRDKSAERKSRDPKKAGAWLKSKLSQLP
jgi:hypothetical protein